MCFSINLSVVKLTELAKKYYWSFILSVTVFVLTEMHNQNKVPVQEFILIMMTNLHKKVLTASVVKDSKRYTNGI